MPIYDYKCEECKGIKETIQLGRVEAPICCDKSMRKLPSLPALVKVDGLGFPSRRKWMDNWTPDSPSFSTGSEHGEKY